MNVGRRSSGKLRIKRQKQLRLLRSSAGPPRPNEQIHYTGQYYATKKVQQDFLKTRFKKRFREEHKDELDKYAASISFFRKHYEGRIPSMKQLKAEKEKLLSLQEEQKRELAVFGKQEKVLQTASC